MMVIGGTHSQPSYIVDEVVQCAVGNSPRDGASNLDICVEQRHAVLVRLLAALGVDGALNAAP